MVHCIAGVYVYAVMWLAGFSLLCTVAVLSMHHRRHKAVPRIVRLIVHDVIGRVLCMNGGNCRVTPEALNQNAWLMVLVCVKMREFETF